MTYNWRLNLAKGEIILNRINRILVVLSLNFILASSWTAGTGIAIVAQEPTPDAVPAEVPREQPLVSGRLIPVRLPITQAAAQQVREALEASLESSRSSGSIEEREIILLEFDTRNSKTGQGSDFHACLALAEMLTDSRMNRIRTVAYIPAPQGLAPGTDQLNARPVSQLKGHALLVALACNELAMHADAVIGEAGIDEQIVGKTRLVSYEEIASKRRIFPVPLARSLIDKELALFRAETSDGMLFVDRGTLEQLQSEGNVISFETVTEEGSFPMLTSQQLDDYRLLRNRVTSRRQLASRLNIDPNSLEVDPTGGQKWSSVQLNVNQYLDRRTVSWLLRSLNQQSESVNLVIVNLNSSDGDPFECLRLAEYLANYDSSRVRTVAYVSEKAGGATSLVALACDHLVMAKSARLGGQWQAPLKPETLQDLSRAVKTLAPQTNHNWAVYMAFVDPNAPLSRMRNAKTGAVELLSDELVKDIDDQADWNFLSSVEIGDSGMTGDEAVQYDIARMLINDFEQLKAYYQLRDEPTILQQTLTDQWIEWFARSLASPWVAAWLLFGAMFLLSTEMSSPGIGVPGFLGTLCLILFFWSQYFDGNAGWLEILLFITGAVFITLEFFVLPGFGVFGIGGLIMVVVSIVLATQTFIFPRNATELSQVPTSLAMVLAAVGGFFAAITLFGKYLPRTPFLKRMLLDPNEDGNNLENRQQREAMVKWEHLLGKKGVAVTHLAPTGKARIGEDVIDVISRGRYIERGDAVEVIEVSGNRVVVANEETTA